jgi:Domain of unknown function (DUF5666)
MFWSYRLLSPRSVALGFIGSIVAVMAFNGFGHSQSQPPQGAASVAVTRPVGTVKSINGNEITLTTGSGSEVSILIQDSTRILRTAPQQTSLKDAIAMTLQELQVGDRVLIRGTPSSDGKSIVASSAIVMKKSDVDAHQDQQREEWRKQGVGGLVRAIEPARGAIDISVASFAGTKNITIHTSKSTMIRRYAPDSVKFDDAKPGTLDQIKPGDQLRARGKHSDDGTEIEAEEIVSGSFRNIAGTVSSIDAGQSTISVMDLIAKKPVTVKIAPDSQVRQLPAMFAMGIAARLKGGNAQDDRAESGDQPNNGLRPVSAPAAEAASGQPQGPRGSGGFPGGNRGSGPPSFQQMLSRLPATTLADLHKGDAVMIVATEGSANLDPTAITVLSGVEPLLTDSRASTLLSPWNLGASPGGDAAAQ